MRIIELFEAPIGDYKTFGDFSKGSSFTKERDRKLITNPSTIEYVKKKFNNSDFVFNMYFVNTKEGRQYTELGKRDIGWVRANLGDEVADAVEPRLGDEDAVNIIFTNNKGSQGVNMTAWIMAHRIAHAFSRGSYAGKKDQSSYAYGESMDHIFETLSMIMDMYGVSNYPNKQRKLSDRPHTKRTQELVLLKFFTAVCTFRSARENIVRDWFEIINELFAQYITTGDIKFNDVPKTFGTTRSGRYFIADEDMADANYNLGGLAETLKYEFDNILSGASDSVLVM